MWGAKTVHTVVARASIGAAVLLATLLTLLPSRVRRKWFERLGSLGRSVDNLLNSTVLFGIDPLADLSALEAGLLPQTVDVDERAENRIVERIAQHGRHPPGVAGIRARAADQAELAREIAEALQARDVVRAQALTRACHKRPSLRSLDSRV
jgi:hypothetical protein